MGWLWRGSADLVVSLKECFIKFLYFIISSYCVRHTIFVVRF